MDKICEIGERCLLRTCNRSIVMERGDGVYLYDDAGNRHLDFVSGVAVNALGHGHEKFLDALISQGKKLCHCSNLYYNKPMVEVAQLLTENSCFDRVFFCNSGAEAIETALKLARKYGKGRSKIITFDHSFHGRTYGALSVTMNPKYQDGFRPLLPGIITAEFNNIASVENVIDDEVCAVIIEPIQGEGGVRVADRTFLWALREICHQRNIVLIFDEIQCGMGRTGKLFAHQGFDVEPDVVCLAKGLGGGFPVGAMLAKEPIAQAFSPGDHGATFGGNPLAMAVVKAVLGEIMKEDFLANVRTVGTYLFEALVHLKTQYGIIKNILGCGLMIGVELTELGDIISRCQENGLLLVKAGSNMVRFLPPLIAQKEHVDEAIKIFERVLKGQ